MLREVHGHSQLHLSEVEDAGSMRGHHHRHLLLAHLRVRGRVLRTRRDNYRLQRAAAIREEVVKEALDLKWSVGSFEPVEGAKKVLMDPSGSEGKVVRIGTTLSSK